MQIDGRNKQCPMPVIMVKKAIQNMTVKENIEVMVDNKIAVENVSKLAKSQGGDVEVTKEEEIYTVKIIFESNEDMAAITEPVMKHGVEQGTILILSSDRMGEGKDDLGTVLIKGFIFAITQLDKLPEMILLYNGGATLSVDGSDNLEDLTYLQGAGVKILTCGTCLSYYGLEDNLGVGEVTNMYEIVEIMATAKKVIRP